MRIAQLAVKVLFFLFLFSVPAIAGYISLKTSLTVETDRDNLMALISTVNKGDESAFNVQAEIRAGEKKLLAERKSELPVNGLYQIKFKFPLFMKTPGIYPLILFMHYTDTNQYPFSALTCKTFSYRSSDMPPEVFGKVLSTSLWKQGKIKLKLKNMGERELKLSGYLVAPRELSVAGNSQEITLPAKSEKEVSYPVENFSALPASNYQIYAITEYDKEGKHLTVISPGLIKIVEKKSFLGLDFSYLTVILVLLLMVLLIAQFIKKK